MCWLSFIITRFGIKWFCSGARVFLKRRGGEQDSQVFVWQGYTGKVELISFKTFLTKPVRRVSLGGDHSLILTYDDCLFTCGSNEHGQLGVPDLSREYSFDPCLVHSLSGKGIQDIACGVSHSGCTTSDGSLYCWGDNHKGQCATDPSLTSINSPRQVPLSLPEAVCEHGVASPETMEHACQVACGATHSLALTTEGNVWVWGHGPQLGLGDLQETWKPTVIKCLIGKNVLKILSGEFHNVLLVEEKGIDNKTPSPDQSKEKGGSSSAEVVVHKLQPSTCGKCKSEIYTYTETLDTCIIEEDHFCKEDSAKTDASKTKSESKETAASKREQGDTRNKLGTEHKHSTKLLETNLDEILSNPTAVNIEIKTPNTDTEQRLEASDVKQTDLDNDPLKDSSEKGQDNVAKDDVCDKSDIAIVEHSVGGKEADQACSNTNKDTEQTLPGADNEAELRKPGSRRKTMEESMTLSLRSDTSISSSHSCKFSRSISFLDETGAREYLARQFHDEDYVPEPAGTSSKTTDELEVKPPDTPASPTAYMMQTVSSLTSHMTSGVTSVTGHMTKALSGIASVPGRLRLSTSGAGEDETKSSTETLEVSEISDLETGSSENINLDNSILDISDLTAGDLTVGDMSLNASQLSIPDSERSLSGVSTPEGSPVKRTGQSSPRRSVSKEPQSIRTIEAQQENLRKRSLTLNAPGEDEALAPTSKYTMATEVWTWGKNSRGQLGLGDMIERSEPYCIQFLSDKRIVKLASGSQHTLALNSSGEVYSWGLNASGQLGHDDMTSCPAKIQLTYDCCVWDVDAGNTHSIFLMDNAGTQGSRPEAFYAGKHPCKDLYVPVYKTPRLTPLKFVRKAGWIRSVSSGGDNCACLARQDTGLTQIQFEMTRYVRQMYMRQLKIINTYIKRLQISGFYTSLDVYPYKSMMTQVMEAFIQVTDKIGIASLELSDLLREGDGFVGATLLTRYDDYVTEWRRYSTAYEDMMAVGGFEYCTKTGSSTFEALTDFYVELLPQSKVEEKVNHAVKFREIMMVPLKMLKELSQIINRFAELYDKTSKENNLLSSVHLNLEHLIRTSNTAVTDAENTRAFWESASSKVSDSLKIASRRLMKESKSSPLSLVHAGRFSTHLFYLFNDLLIHSQYSSYQSYPLETVWIDTPTSESGTHHYITVTTPEDVLNLNASSPTVKVEWVVAFKTAINKVLANQKSVSRQNSGDRLHTPVVRLASHTFTKHTLYKDAKYKGYWLNGKIHGSGVMKWPDGRRYKGKFRHGAQTGYGVMMIPRDNKKEEVQEGNWKEGKLHGPGKIKYSTGDLYEGCFKDGLRHGHGIYRKGRYLNSASFVYVGEWLYDRKHGYGVMDDILKGEKYMGMWQDDSRHGDGVVVTLDGMYFEGNFQYNKLVGFGLMLTDDNSCYEGEFSGITMLQGKGTLIFPVGDKIEGTFSGTWNQGLKITSGTFHKFSGGSATKSSPEARSSLYGKLCVRPDRKWEEIFYQCFENLHYSGEGEPNTPKAWDQVVNCIVAGKQSLKDKKRESLVSRQMLQLKNLDQLEKIPTHSVSRLTIEHFKSVSEYLVKAFETHAHPLGRLVEDLVDVFRAAYIGIGAHPRLLHHATREIQSFIRRIYRVIRILFPELPQSGGPTLVYPESSRRECSPIGESHGFLERQISQTDEELTVETISAAGILQPILLPRIYPALFDLYALHSDRTDEKYWERVQKLNRQGDVSLMAYLGIEQSFWCMDDAVFQDHRKRISGLRDQSYASSVEMLQQISTAFCPEDKLKVLQRTFLNITQTIQEYLDEAHMLCMDDLFPIFQYVVIRARLHHLGAEIEFIEELMEKHLEFGELGIMFTTLKACYYQIQNEKMPIH